MPSAGRAAISANQPGRRRPAAGFDGGRAAGRRRALGSGGTNPRRKHRTSSALTRRRRYRCGMVRIRTLLRVASKTRSGDAWLSLVVVFLVMPRGPLSRRSISGVWSCPLQLTDGHRVGWPSVAPLLRSVRTPWRGSRKRMSRLWRTLCDCFRIYMAAFCAVRRSQRTSVRRSGQAMSARLSLSTHSGWMLHSSK
jgi:hypothetical protein